MLKNLKLFALELFFICIFNKLPMPGHLLIFSKEWVQDCASKQHGKPQKNAVFFLKQYIKTDLFKPGDFPSQRQAITIFKFTHSYKPNVSAGLYQFHHRKSEKPWKKKQKQWNWRIKL